MVIGTAVKIDILADSVLDSANCSVIDPDGNTVVNEQAMTFIREETVRGGTYYRWRYIFQSNDSDPTGTYTAYCKGIIGTYTTKEKIKFKLEA